MVGNDKTFLANKALHFLVKWEDSNLLTKMLKYKLTDN